MLKQFRAAFVLLATLVLILSACAGLDATAVVANPANLIEEVVAAVDTPADSAAVEALANPAEATGAPAAQANPQAAQPGTLTAAPILDLAAQQQAFIDLFQRANPAVVGIQMSAGQGSGFVVDAAGYIITNNHVVAEGGQIFAQFADGTTREAELIGTDPDSDLAVLKVDAAPGELAALELADSDTLQVGQIVIAIGSPFGLANTLTTGVISGLDRLFPGAQSPDGSYYNIPDIIQTDAAINPGNSGGPLLDLNGRVIGVNTAIESPVRGSSGVGFAVPSSVVASVYPEIVANGRVQHAWLGISGSELNSAIAEELGLDPAQRGIAVGEVISGGPAARAGIQAADVTNGRAGDIIVGVDGVEVTTFSDLLGYIVTDARVGDTVSLTVLRDGQLIQVPVTLAERPTQAG